MREKELQVTNNRDRVAMHAKLCLNLPSFSEKENIDAYTYVGLSGLQRHSSGPRTSGQLT